LEDVRDELKTKADIASPISLKKLFEELLLNIRKYCVCEVRATSGLRETGSLPASLSRGKGWSWKLKPLEIKSFDGDVTEWPAFWNIFTANIDKGEEITPATKFAYLKSIVSGTAYEVIKHLSVTDMNYELSKEIKQPDLENLDW
jgi:Protein of unknown function (DUF1759)